MAKLDDVPGGREWLPEAKRRGLTYDQYYNRIFVLDYPPEVAATKPLSTELGRHPDPSSIRQRCIAAGIEPSMFHFTRRRYPEKSVEEVLDFIKARRKNDS